MGTKRKRKHKPASLTHRVTRTYVAGEKWVVEERPLEQPLPELKPGEGWYVLRVGARRENTAAQRVKDAGFVTYVPRYQRKARRQRQERTSEPALIPGYIFVGIDCSAENQAKVLGIDAADLERRLRRRTIEWTDPRTGECFDARVREAEVKVDCDFLRHPSSGEPVRVPDKLMERFVREVSLNTRAGAFKAVVALKVGARVMVKDGPFASFFGVIEGADRGFFKVAIELFGRVTPVELGSGSVEAA